MAKWHTRCSRADQGLGHPGGSRDEGRTSRMGPQGVGGMTQDDRGSVKRYGRAASDPCATGRAMSGDGAVVRERRRYPRTSLSWTVVWFPDEHTVVETRALDASMHGIRLQLPLPADSARLDAGERHRIEVRRWSSARLLRTVEVRHVTGGSVGFYVEEPLLLQPICPVCGESILTVDGVARAGDDLVHGRCYVMARGARETPPLREASEDASVRPGRRLLRRLFGGI